MQLNIFFIIYETNDSNEVIFNLFIQVSAIVLTLKAPVIPKRFFKKIIIVFIGH